MVYEKVISSAFSDDIITGLVRDNAISYLGFQNNNTSFPISMHVQGKIGDNDPYHFEIAKVPRVYAFTDTIASTINLSYTLGDIITVGFGEQQLPSVVNITIPPATLPLGRTLVLFINVEEDKVIKFANSTIIDTTSNGEDEAGYYCATFVNVTGNSVNSVSVWRTPGIVQTN